MSAQTKQLRRKIKEASKENILKQQAIDNLESKQKTFSQYIQKLNSKTESLKAGLKNRTVRQTIVIRMMKAKQTRRRFNYNNKI